MNKFIFVFFISFAFLFAQENLLPKGFAPLEINQMDGYLNNLNVTNDVITTPPDFSVRTMAEWEEIQALTIAWEGFEPILTEIVRNSVDQCKVIIACDSPGEVQNYLEYNNVETSNVEYLNVNTNSIWMRDYGQNTIYENDVDSLYLVDWIYNRPRPDDDAFPEYLAESLDLDVYQTSMNPYRIVATGGNFMSDGFGTAFSSNLILDENDGSGPYNSLSYPNHSESEINDIMNDFLGIQTYIKMDELPYDAIHHIDMHMKLLDEETLLVAEYPEGMSDGPQIEENLEYILNNFSTKWGTPFNVIRIPSPPSSSGAYPGSQPFNQTDGYYRTYTNSVFVNKTVIVPFYREEYDTIAQRIYEEALPGYNIVGIDCDNNGNNIISLSGAIHCITHSVGVNEPLLISYKKIENVCVDTSPYVSLTSLVKHRSGIDEVFFNYKTEDDTEFTSVSMQSQGNDEWNVVMTFDQVGVSIEYFVHAIANNGKEQYRPMTALEGGVNSFVYEQCGAVFGCTDPEACNYDPTILPAGFDDGSCVYPYQFYDCEDNCINDIDNDLICDELDNCPDIYNPNQEDFNSDNQGDACDGIGLHESLNNKKLVKVIDMLGRDQIYGINQKVLFLIFDDGSVKKQFIN